MMVEGRKKRRRYYKNTRKEDLVYLVNEFFFNVKLFSSCKILKIPKSGDPEKKRFKQSTRKKEDRDVRQMTPHL